MMINHDIDQRHTLLHQWAGAIDQAARLGALSGDKPIAIREISGRKKILESVRQGIGQPMEVVSPARQSALHDALRAATVEVQYGVLNFLSGDQLTQSVVL